MGRRGVPGRAIAGAVLASLATLPLTAHRLPAQREGGREPTAGPLPTIEARTAGMQKLDGFFPLYWDSTSGHLYLEIAHLNTEVLHIQGMGTGLGSNDIGVERGNLQRSEIVFFEKQGPKVLLVKPNYAFRATFTKNPDEIESVKQSFARSVLWGFQAVAESPGRVLVDFTDFLLADPNTITQRLRPGSYRLDASRSSIYLPMTQNFPKNTEMEAELTWVRQRPAGPPQGGIAPPRPGSFNPFPGPETFFEGVNRVAADPRAASLRVHHSFVALPDAGYVPRTFDPRSGYGPIVWKDYSVPPDGDEMTFMQRLIRRHRLKKQDPTAAMSDPVQPIVYYVDPAVPEPQRSALMEGVGWWNQAFTAAGYRNAFQVKIRPDTISPLDVRYNVINWVHRSTRGYSSGMTVTDPRTGEILKGLVTLGSLRYRQDYLIAEALLLPYKNGTEVPPDMREWALARMRQLAAHESGHTLGFIHNYYDSKRGRISVMDYPAPLVTLKPDGSLDISKVYERGVGPWDSVAIKWGYQDFPPGTNEQAALDKILNDAWARDLLLLTNQDMDANPRADQWSNGWDPAAELSRLMEIRRVVLKRWGEASIRRGMPMAEMEEVLVPAYMYHGFQIVAAASALGGMHYVYAMRGGPGGADGDAQAVRAGAAGRGDPEAAAATRRLPALPRAVPALHGAHVRQDQPGRDGRGDHRAEHPDAGPRRATRGAARARSRAARAGRGRGLAALGGVQRPGSESVRGRDRPRGAERGGRPADAARRHREHARGPGDRHAAADGEDESARQRPPRRPGDERPLPAADAGHQAVSRPPVRDVRAAATRGGGAG